MTPSVLLGTFELDGNATTGVLGPPSGSTTSSHDWDQVFADAGSPSGSGSFVQGSTSAALAGSFFTDKVSSNTDDIFQGGGSKDTLGIQQGRWLFTGSKPQGKDDITHAYAAAYTVPVPSDPVNPTHLILYAGLDRFDNSGDATAGFWFFRNNIGQNPSVTTNGGHPFTGTHADGDILLVSDFTIGGSTSTIKVFRWTGDDATGSLVAVSTPDPNSTFAIVNGSAISVPWSYTDKRGNSSPAAGEFLEEGVDLTALGLQGCFASFQAETRSSQSPTATLSDFVLGSFPLCSIAAPGFTGLSKVGDPVTYPLTVQNTGATKLFLQNVTDTLLGTIVVNGVVQQPGAAGVDPHVTSIATSGVNPDGSLAPGAQAIFFVTRTVQAGDPDPTNSTVTFNYNARPDFSGDVESASADNSVNLFQPSASLTETVSPTSATSLGQPITYTFTVTNTSSSDSPNLVLDLSNPNDSFTDSLLTTAAGYNLEADAIHAATGDNTATVASIAPGASFSITETRPIQAGDPTPLTDTSNVAFTLAQNFGNFTNIITAHASASVTLLPHLEITKAVTPGFSDVIHPGDTASFTITVNNDGAGPATNVLVTDQLPAADQLAWKLGSFTFDTASISTSDLLTASSASLPAGATEAVTVSALIPLDIFGTTGGGTGSGDPVAAGVFELDGNATTGVLGTSGSTTTSHDWDQVFNDVTNMTSTSGALATSFVSDVVNTTADFIFTGGGSKDVRGIQQGPWLFTDSKPQAKNDIEHAYAASYTDPSNGHFLLFAGMDRFDNSGDATAGFWFFQNPVGLSTSNPTSSGSPFTGTHKDGDLLLVSDFSIGGSTSTITVFRWTGDDATGSLVQVSAPGTTTFAIVNSGPIAVPWSFTDKSHNSSPAAGEFLEEGVDLTALGLGGCFSNFMAETRSSTAPDATLSDFVSGNFNTCKLLLPNTATVQADGIAPITSNQVLITVLDGAALEAPSVGGIAGTSMLTPQQLQPVVTQAIAGWAATGIDPGSMSNLDNVTFHIGKLPGAELGYEIPGEIWIDQNAAGWGWALNGGPGMDLRTVVSHEIGHALGFEHSATGVMQDVLQPSVQRLPQALTVSGPTVPGLAVSNASATTPQAVVPAGFGIGQLMSNAISTPARTGMNDALLTLPAFSGATTVDTAIRGVVGLPVMIQDRAGSQMAMPVNLAGPTAVTPSTTVRSAADRESIGIPAPSLRPPTDQGAPFAPSSGEAGAPADMAVPPDAMLLFWERAGAADATSDEAAEDASIGQSDGYPVADSAAAVVLVFGLAGWAAQPTEKESEKESRKQRQRLVDCI